jgi:peptidoglycan-associated lipoprotein
MKIVAKLAFGWALFFLFSADIMAQQDFFKDAETAFTNKEFFNAIALYKKAYTKERKFETKALIIFRTGECYRSIGDFKQSEAWYFKAIKANYTNPKAKLYLADAKRAQGKYDEAIVEYNNYKAEVPSDPRGEAGVKASELAKEWTSKPTLYNIDNVTLINTKDREFSPCFVDRKYNKIYFTSTRPGVKGNDFDATIGEFYSDIFETSVDKKGVWSTPVALIEPVNTKNNEGLTSITKKGDAMYFTRCVPVSNKVVYNQLWSSVRKGNAWGEPEKLPFCNDTNKFAAPAISDDGMTLFFSSDLPGGQGENDIWMAKFDKKEKKWGAPINLGTEINTAGNEVFPYIHDDKTLYFSSDGHLGMGGLDIFKAESVAEDSWGNVKNMNYPLNSPSDDFGIIFESNKERGYLTSNREGTKGLDDIWSFVLPPLLFSIEGVILDSKFKEPIEGVTVKLQGSDGTTVELKTDANGVYKFAENPAGGRYVNPNTSYVVSTQVGNDVITKNSKYGFVNSSERWTETTVGEKESKVFKGHNFSLTSIEKFIKFPDVLYDLGKSTLRAEAQDSLLFLYQTLLDNPTFVIELSAHTDSRGSDVENMKLSEARAKACYDFLVAKGISAARVIPKGYGEKALLITDKQINVMKTIQEKEAAHQKNRRTVFSVLRKDYVDPNAPKEVPKVEAPSKTEINEVTPEAIGKPATDTSDPATEATPTGK